MFRDCMVEMKDVMGRPYKGIIASGCDPGSDEAPDAATGFFLTAGPPPARASPLKSERPSFLVR